MTFDREEWGKPFGCAPVLCCGVLAAALCGCMDTSPAARSNRAEYGAVTVRIDGSRNTVRLSFGDGLYASADAKDTSEQQTVSPTQTVSPSVELPLPMSPLAMGIQAAGKVGAEAVKTIGGKAGGNGAAAGAAGAASADCPGGDCGGAAASAAASADCPGGDCSLTPEGGR